LKIIIKMNVLTVLNQKNLEVPNQIVYTFIDSFSKKHDLTYKELDDESRRIAVQILKECKVGDRVILLFPTGLPFVKALWACFRAGVVPVPIPIPQPHKAIKYISSIIEDSEAILLLSTEALGKQAKPVFTELRKLVKIVELASIPVSNLEVFTDYKPIDKDSTTLIQYTSGTTSNPKGVMVSHENLISNLYMMKHAAKLNEEHCLVTWLPHYHDMGLIQNFIGIVIHGGHLVFMSPESFIGNPLSWLQLISEYKAYFSAAPNFGYDFCVKRISDEQCEGLDLSSWKVAINGSEPINAKTLASFYNKFNAFGLSNETLTPAYGTAEAVLGVAIPCINTETKILHAKKVSLEQDKLEFVVSNKKSLPIVSCGKPMLGVEIIIVNPDTLERLETNILGEIWISGPNISKGYWKREAETKEVFGAYTSNTQEGPFYRTGDLGFLDEENNVYITGRKKDLIVIKGRNLYPQDIESSIEEGCLDVRKGCVAAFPIIINEEESIGIVAEVNPKTEKEPFKIIQEIKRIISSEFQASAGHIALIPVRHIHKTTSGKLQRKSCKMSLENQRLKLIKEWKLPQIEKAIEGISVKEVGINEIQIQNWLIFHISTTQGLPIHEVSLENTWEELGFDSIQFPNLLEQLREVFDVNIPVKALAMSKTLNQLAYNVLNYNKVEMSSDLEEVVKEDSTINVEEGREAKKTFFKPNFSKLS
jgi:acyl-CoA synthetase (AMP-forming)/AMP-acid ligase II/acyl carrier protein